MREAFRETAPAGLRLAQRIVTAKASDGHHETVMPTKLTDETLAATTKSGTNWVQSFRLDGRQHLSFPPPSFGSSLKERRRNRIQELCRRAGSRGGSSTHHPHSSRAPLDPLEECWSTTSHDANPNGSPQIDRILQSLHSPAPQFYYVIRRAINRALERASEAHDRQEAELAAIERELSRCSYLLKPGRQFLVRRGQSLPELDAEISTHTSDEEAPLKWSAGRVVDPPPDGWKAVLDGSRDDLSVVALASEALDVVLDASERMEDADPAQLELIVSEIRARLRFTLGTDVRGRASSDAAFALSLAGVTDEALYDTLLHVSVLEMRRLSRRPSKAAKDYLHIVEKVAASGALRRRNERLQELYALAAEGLADKGSDFQSVAQVLATPNVPFDLFSHRPMLWLWRYSSRLAKPQMHVYESAKSDDVAAGFDWGEVFRNSSLPLIVDVGCGLGTSLLGLASTSGFEQQLRSHVGGFDLSTCNFVGGDLNTASLRYGSGIATRWNLTDRLCFMPLSADSLLDLVRDRYDGPVALIMIQFPTPYRLGTTNEGGNSQLPAGIDDGFMVTKSVMRKIADVLRKSKGCLMIQTNCEDVALALRDRALEHGLTTVNAEEPDPLETHIPEPNIRLPERTIEWIHLGGDRAIGPEWWRTPVLPPRCATETEVACLLQGTPIHRCLMRGPI